MAEQQREKLQRKFVIRQGGLLKLNQVTIRQTFDTCQIHGQTLEDKASTRTPD